MKKYILQEVETIKDQSLLAKIAQEDDDPDVRRTARDRLDRLSV